MSTSANTKKLCPFTWNIMITNELINISGKSANNSGKKIWKKVSIYASASRETTSWETRKSSFKNTPDCWRSTNIRQNSERQLLSNHAKTTTCTARSQSTANPKAITPSQPPQAWERRKTKRGQSSLVTSRKALCLRKNTYLLTSRVSRTRCKTTSVTIILFRGRKTSNPAFDMHESHRIGRDPSQLGQVVHLNLQHLQDKVLRPH